MQATRTTVLGLATLTALGLMSARPAAAQSQHYYDLTQGFTDAYGGPSLVSEGGTQDSSGYSFTADKGLDLTGALSNLDSYSIDMVLSLAGNNSPRDNGYQKLIDFQGLTQDVGLYDHNGDLNFYDDVTGPTQVFTPGQSVNILLTRSTAGVVTGYADGVQQFQFADTGNNGVFSSNFIEFFHDDTATSGQESPTGVVQSISINGGVAPEPSQFAGLGLGVLGLAGLALRARKRRTA